MSKKKKKFNRLQTKIMPEVLVFFLPPNPIPTAYKKMSLLVFKLAKKF